jgi:hypothetical protein
VRCPIRWFRGSRESDGPVRPRAGGAIRPCVQSATDSTVFAGAVRFAQVAVAHHTMAAPVPGGVGLRRATAAIVNGVTAWVALR